MTIQELIEQDKDALHTIRYNDLCWYLVMYTDETWDLKHKSALSAIFECSKDASDYEILEISQCWNGEDLL